MTKILTLVTGPIIGLHSDLFLKQTVELASRLNIGLYYFNFFDEMFELENENVTNQYQRAKLIGEYLDTYKYQFKDKRQKTILSISNKIKDLPGTSFAIVRMPSTVRWRGINLQFKDHKFLAKYLKPDRMVTLIDAEWNIFKSLKSEFGTEAIREITKEEDFSIGRILEWLAAEVSTTEDWAEWIGQINGKEVKHLVLGVRIPMKEDRKKYVPNFEEMLKLATNEDITTFYASYSMSQATDEVRDIINDSIWELKKYGVVIDPGSIEIGKEIDKEDEKVVFSYTVLRDLWWDVGKVDVVIAFHPYHDNPPLSTGMIDEIGHAKALKKERYLVFPRAISPFTGDNLIPKECLFENKDELFAYLNGSRDPLLTPRFEEIQNEFIKYYRELFPKGL